MNTETASPTKVPWNKGKIVGQKAPLKLKDIWAIRIRLQLGKRTRELALFDLGLNSKLRACDLVRLRVRDICHGDRASLRAIVMQQKTFRPFQFEISQPTRDAVTTWIKETSALRVVFSPVPTPGCSLARRTHRYRLLSDMPSRLATSCSGLIKTDSPIGC